MAFAASVIRTVSGLEVEVMHAYARIVEGTDPEALHDLRVAARRLRSLLKPLRLGALAEDLDRAAKALGQATNPIRDMEVMAAELERHGLLIPASLRRQAVLRWYRQGSSPQIKDLLDALDAWPDGVRRAMTEGRLDDLEAEASKRIRHQLRKLLAALDDPGHDLHDIRLLVKRARYSQEAYPDLCPLPGKVLDTLKTLQTMLGIGTTTSNGASGPKSRPTCAPERGMAQVRGRRPGPGRGIRSAPCQVAGESHRPHLSGSATWPGGLSGAWANRAARGGFDPLAQFAQIFPTFPFGMEGDAIGADLDDPSTLGRRGIRSCMGHLPVGPVQRSRRGIGIDQR